MTPRTQIAARRIGHVTILDLQGRLVLDEGDSLLREHIDALVRQGPFDVVLNLQDVTYIDSCGLGAIVDQYLSVRKRGGDLKLLRLSERTRRVLAMTHLLSIFDVFESEDDAVRSFAEKHAMAVVN